MWAIKKCFHQNQRGLNILSKIQGGLRVATLHPQARVQGGGPRGSAPPPRNWKAKKKKKKKKVIRANFYHQSYFTYIFLLFQSKMSFSQLFSELGPPLKHWKAKKKKKKKRLSDFGPPPLQIPGHAPDPPPPSLEPVVEDCQHNKIKFNCRHGTYETFRL